MKFLRFSSSRSTPPPAPARPGAVAGSRSGAGRLGALARLLPALALAAVFGGERAAAANPIITNVYTADPAALVHDGRVYLYTGHDEAPAGTTAYVMREWLCFSSADMVNWRAEGSPLSLAAFTWARQDAWAGHVVERDGKFYFYAPMSHRAINGFAIGVAVADQPTGPFVDARGSALITNDMTSNSAGITWDDIDPAVFIDDDGQAYLFWGNTVLHYVKLKANMIETEGPIQTVTLPQFTEAPWVHKRNGLYYLSYAYGWEEKIAYATSTSIAGPWTFRGVINDYVPNCNTNHQAIVEFQGKSYFIYHNGAAPGGGSWRRSVCVDLLEYNEDGTIKPVVQTSAGVSAATAPAVTATPGVTSTVPSFSNVTVHDPSVIRDGANFYVFGSHMAAASTTDLMRWTQLTTSAAYPNTLIRNQNPLAEFSEALAYAGYATTFWAPDVVRLADGKYYNYYCACQGSSPLSALGVAVADSVAGPYANVGILLKSMGASPTVTPYNATIHPNVVDPSVFFDQAGRLWMVYGSYSGGIFILEMDPATGRQLPNQGYGKKLIGGMHSRIEAPYILHSPESGYYYLFLSFFGLGAADGYNIRVGRSRQPDGPYLDAAGNDLTNVRGNFAFDDATISPYGVKLMGGYQFLHAAGEPQNVSRGYLSPGHCSAYRDPATGQYFLFFHTRFVGRGEQHEVRVHQMYLNDQDWLVAAPHRYAGETPDPTPLALVPGDWKLITHTKPLSGIAKASVAIALAADGSVTGATTGTWQVSGENFVTLTLAGTAYHGVFSRQWDDDNKVWVLAFSALAADGVSIWGSKVAAVPAAPTITRQPASVSGTVNAAASLSVAAAEGWTFQWFRGGRAVDGANRETLSFPSLQPGDAGLYDVVVSGAGNALSVPAVVGVVPADGARTAGAVSTRLEWQDIRHPNGNVYDQFLLSGAAGTFTAAPGKIARMSYLDSKNSIVQVEMSGAGAVTVVLENAAGPIAPAFYNQAGIEYMQGDATIIVAGADATTHVSTYSVGTFTNPGVTRGDVAYVGWAHVRAMGIASTTGGFGGIHQGNVAYTAAAGPTGIYAPTVTSVAGMPIVVHDLAATALAVPYLFFGAAGRIDVKIAGGSLAQPGGDTVTVSGLREVRMGAGLDSCGRDAPAVAIRSSLVNEAGVDVTAALVVGP